jgi:ParB/RepB/Spo0J family partition protein
MKSNDNNLIYTNHRQLLLHPRNIRQYYPPDDVAEMAESIRASGGVWQALLIVPAEAPETYYVVDGNMRLAGGRLLGDSCPLLKCEVIDADAAEQLLIMAATSKYHYPKDPISEALHLKRLRDEEGLSIERICELIGFSPSFVHGRLRLLTLDKGIQDLIQRGVLGPAPLLYHDLMRIPDPAKRLELAERFVRNGTSRTGMGKSISHVLAQMKAMGQVEPPPAVPAQPAINGHATNGHLNGAGRKAKKGATVEAGIPARKILDLAGQVLCEGCRLEGLGQKCWTCPGPYELIQSLVEMAEFRAEPAPVGNGVQG